MFLTQYPGGSFTSGRILLDDDFGGVGDLPVAENRNISYEDVGDAGFLTMVWRVWALRLKGFGGFLTCS
jgi:hypothetical protein